MKKFILSLTLLVSTSILFAQTDVISEIEADVPYCPPGTRYCGFSQSCTFRNFHRPKHDCLYGFWFCNDCTPPVVKCCDYFGKVANVDSVTKNITFLMRILKGNKIEFRFPAAMKDNTTYTDEDLKNFSVDDARKITLGKYTIKLVIGDYKTEVVGNEIIVLVDYIK